MKKLGIVLQIAVALVVGWDQQPEINEDNIVNEDEFANVEKAGTYFVKYQVAEATEVQKIVRITVTRLRTTVSDSNQEGIDANDFEVTVDTSCDLMPMIDAAQAHAWDTQTGYPVNIETVSCHFEQFENGLTPVTFCTARDTCTTVYMRYIDSGHGLQSFYFNGDNIPFLRKVYLITIMIFIYFILPLILVLLIFLGVRHWRKVIKKEIENNQR